VGLGNARCRSRDQKHATCRREEKQLNATFFYALAKKENFKNMKRKILTLTLSAILCLGTATFKFAPPTASQPKLTTPIEPAKFALLIGINNYSDRNIRPLRGTENDVILMRGLLTELYGFKAGTDIKELVSSEKSKTPKPTRDNILKFFNEHLIKNAEDFKTKNNLTPDKGATVVFYYSGHGSHLPDDNGDEPDRRDETIVPTDSTKDITTQRDIRDDELNDLFNKLRQHTTNITFIFDSCHSGTITRGKGSRSLDRLAPDAGSRGNGVDITLGDSISASDSYVTISGSLPNEESQEDAIINPQTKQMQMNGYLTFYLAQELRATPDATYRDVMQRVKTAVTKQNENQHPQAEGDIDRAFLGSSQTRGRTPILLKSEPRKEGADSIFTIDAGKILGAYLGGTVAVYRERIQPENLIGSGEITEPTDDFTATVKVAGKEVPKTAKIVLATPFFGTNKRIVALDLKTSRASNADTGLQMIKRLEERLKANDYVQPRTLENPLAEANLKSWDVAFVRSTYGVFKEGNRQPAPKNVNLPAGDEEIYFLSNKDGMPVYNFWVRAADPDADKQIVDALEKYVRVENLKTIGNSTAGLSGGLKIELMRLKSFDRPPVGSNTCAAVEIDPQEREADRRGAVQLKPGEHFYFEITNNTGERLFPYLYSIAPDGKVTMLYPPRGAEEAISDGVTMKTWGSRKCHVFRATGIDKTAVPYGTETFKVIAATQPFNGILLESKEITTAREALKTTGRSGSSALNLLLAGAATNQRSEVANFPFTGWATASIEIEIKEK
jgi:hypothetical protein